MSECLQQEWYKWQETGEAALMRVPAAVVEEMVSIIRAAIARVVVKEGNMVVARELTTLMDKDAMVKLLECVLIALVAAVQEVM